MAWRSMTLKEIVGLLDAAAWGAKLKNEVPATYKQCWFLASLMLKVNACVDNEFHPLYTFPPHIRLTKKRASELIKQYITKA